MITISVEQVIPAYPERLKSFSGSWSVLPPDVRAGREWLQIGEDGVSCKDHLRILAGARHELKWQDSISKVLEIAGNGIESRSISVEACADGVLTMDLMDAGGKVKLERDAVAADASQALTTRLIHVDVEDDATIHVLKEKLSERLGVDCAKLSCNVPLAHFAKGADGVSRLETEERHSDGQWIRNRSCLEYGISDGCSLHVTDFSTLVSEVGCSIARAEDRAITLAQLRNLWYFLQARSQGDVIAGWYDSSSFSPGFKKPLRLSHINLYQVRDWVILPAAYAAKSSYVELIAEGPQPPEWFCSHWWGEPVFEFIKCLEEHRRVRDIAITIGYWVCAYANNQFQLGADIDPDPKKTSFFRAMEKSIGVLAIVDEMCQCFHRIWCVFEEAVALTPEMFRNDHLEPLELDIATTVGSTASVVSGVRKLPLGSSDAGRSSWFPLGVLRKASEIEVVTAQASEPVDRQRILNTISGMPDLDQEPPSSHESFQRMEIKLKSIFAVAGWRAAIQQSSDEDLKSFVDALKLDKERRFLHLDFSDVLEFSNEDLSQLASAIPIGLHRLFLVFNRCPIDKIGLQHLGDSLPAALRCFSFHACECTILDDEGIAALARGFPKMLQSLELHLGQCTKLSSRGVAALAKQMPASLKDLQLHFQDCNALRDTGLASLADGLPQDLASMVLNFSGCQRINARWRRRIDLHEKEEFCNFFEDRPRASAEFDNEAPLRSIRKTRRKSSIMDDCMDYYTEAVAIWEQLEEYDEKPSVRLVNGRWLVKNLDEDHSRRRSLSNRWTNPNALPRRQDLPEEAFIPTEELQSTYENSQFLRSRKILPLVAISHCWLTPAHPDPDACQFVRLQPLVELLLKHYEKSAGVRNFGFFLDWCSLYQDPREPDEAASFGRSLKRVELWYVHQQTTVWLLTSIPEGYSSKQYNARGWPNFEHHASEMITPQNMVLDLGNLQCNSCADYDSVQSLCKAARGPPISPEDFKDLLERLSFTVRSDRSMIAFKYRRTAAVVLRSVEELNYSSLAWDDGSMEMLPGVFPLCMKLQRIKLSRNEIGNTGAVIIASALPECKELKVLNLNQNRISNRGMAALRESLQHTESLQMIFLIGQKTSDPSQKKDDILANEALSPWQIEAIDLEKDGIGSVGAGLLASLMPNCPELQWLQLDFNNIGIVGTKMLAKSLPQCSQIHLLHLWGNSLTDVGAGMLASALPQCSNLKTLCLHENLIGDSGATALSKVMPACLKLEQFGLGKNLVGDVGVEDLAVVLPRCLQLQGFRIFQNLFGSAGAESLAIYLPQCPNLKQVGLGSCKIDDAGARALANIASDCPELKLLFLDANPVSEDCKQELRKINGKCSIFV